MHISLSLYVHLSLCREKVCVKGPAEVLSLDPLSSNVLVIPSLDFTKIPIYMKSTLHSQLTTLRVPSF